MKQFEEELSSQLRRVEAPASLADGVMRRVAAENPRPIRALPGYQAWMGRLAALLLITALLFGAGAAGIQHHRSVVRARAERDFARSLELTSRAFEPVRRHLQRAGVALDE